MNKIIKLGAISAGGFLLFTSAFILFTALAGVPLRDVAVLGPMLGEPEPVEELASSPGDTTDAPIKTDGEVIEASVSALDAFLLESPFDTRELTSLQDELKGKLRDLAERHRRARERELQQDEREEFLDMRYEELMKLRSTLEDFESELFARKSEVERDERSQKQREKESWKKLARSFEDGEEDALVERLTLYPAKDAARILHSLGDERAGLLLPNALPTDKYKEYADAYLAYRDSE